MLVIYSENNLEILDDIMFWHARKKINYQLAQDPMFELITMSNRSYPDSSPFRQKVLLIPTGHRSHHKLVALEDQERRERGIQQFA
jgi:hypothetical protein